METVEVYLVGDKHAPDTNSWLAMTNSQEEAVRLMRTLEGATSLKTINVEQKPNGSNQG